MTDIHVQPELKADQGFSKAIDKVNQLKPDFVVTGGDLIMDALGQSFERSINLYDLYNNLCKKFEMPVYNTLGNHEVFGLYEKSGIDPKHPEYGKTMFENRLGNNKTYFSFDHKDWHFIVLDAIGFTEERKYIGLIDSAQIQWIKDDLNKTDKKTAIAVFTHIPLISATAQLRNGGTAALSPSSVVSNSNEVIGLFNEHDLRLVLQGHLHIVEEIIFKNIHFITGGAVSGKWWKGAHHGFSEGFVVVDIENKEIDWQYQTYGWKAQEN
jgi:3',5'-cyclic AMP phosphodiesterase CpdA